MTATYWTAAYSGDGERACYSEDEWEAARKLLVELLAEHANNVRSWVPAHDCDDIPCPTFDDDCGDQVAASVELLVWEVEQLTAGSEWAGSVGGYRYRLTETPSS